jgi:TolB-like protein/class 3 adenylate cyclase/tetratricopeptide (TPR) repeat protein
MTDQEGKPRRRLTAIMATDVVGYSKLMQSDEAAALAGLSAIRKATQEHIERHQGRIANTAGDSVLVEFGSAADAVGCALALQEQLTSQADRELQLRIGIHLGDVVDKGGDLFGSAVNIAARLEGIAQPGGIVVSAAVRDAVSGKLSAVFNDLGLKTLKNIDEPLRAYALMPKAAVSPGMFRSGGALPLPSKPSLAVLPFSNISGNPEQQYFSDGITEDIITELSRWHQLSVLSRSSSFHYRDKMSDAKAIGRQLGVRYVVEGSIRQIGNRVRVTAQLVDAVSGSHLWAERYDRGLDDIFAVQDEVVQTIVATLVGRVQAAGADLAKRKPPTNLAAYDCVLRGRALPWGDPNADAEALHLYHKAIELDPDYGIAYALLALMMYHEWDYDMSGSSEILDRAFEHAKRAVELDEDESFCHFMLGFIYMYQGAHDLAVRYYVRALEMNPNNPEHMADMGGLLAYQGRAVEGLEWLRRATRIDPYFNPPFYWFLLGLAYFVARQHHEAIAAFERSKTRPFYMQAFLAASNALKGDIQRAVECSAECLRLKPDFSIRPFASKHPFKTPDDREHFVTGLRKAGLPE